MQTKRETKAARRAALRARLDRALSDIYGNARTRWPDDDVRGFTSFYDWLGGYAERAADYMQGERFGMTERETRAPEWRPASERLARARNRRALQDYPGQWRAEARNNHAFPCGEFERERSALIREGVPKCYSYGRNGKTFYPTTWATENGRGFRVHDVEEMSAEAMTAAVQWLEQFNAHVRSVADDAAAVYLDEAREALAERADTLRDDIRENRESFALLARELRGLRHVNAPAACGILRERLRGIARDVRDAARELSGVNATLQAVRE